MDRHQAIARQLAVRVEDLLREAGVLILALTPLEAASWNGSMRVLILVPFFITLGASLFRIAWILERRRMERE